MMGLPDGWVTGVPNLTRNDELKALGNGVVPQQAFAAYAALLDLDVAAMSAQHETVGSKELLPTPSVALGTGGQRSRSGGRKGELLLGGIAVAVSAGNIENAVSA